MTRRVAAGPAEGWLSLLLVTIMCVTMAWSIDDVAPVMGRTAFTDFLMFAAIGGVLFGFIGPKVGWGRWLTYLVGAVVAALIIPILAGGVANPDQSWSQQFTATADAAFAAYLDLVVKGLSFTQEFRHHLLVLGLLMWASSMFASYATFGHGRPLNGVVIVGVILVFNMSFTVSDQLGYLILYSIASLLLLIRSHALEEQAEWTRRRIGDPSAISGVYLRGGSVFIALAIVGSVLLTVAASSAPLAGAWNGVSDGVLDMSRSVARFLPGGPNNRNLGTDFGDDTQIRGFWVSDPAVVAVIRVPAGEREKFYWRAVTRDRFDHTGWSSTRDSLVETAYQPGAPVFDGSMEALPTSLATREMTFVVTPVDNGSKLILAPILAVSVDEPTTLTSLGDGGLLNKLVRPSSSDAYVVTANVPVRDGAVEGGLEENRLREAGRTYPAEITDYYLQVPDDTMGPSAHEMLAEMVAAMPDGADSTPFDIAQTMERIFRRPSTATYKTNVQNLPCVDERLSTVECFARYREGYCEFYATTMAIFLRELGIPSRIVDGYQPGTRDERTGLETIQALNRHEWVEVWFPGYGWVPFDPTGGGRAQLGALPSGAPPVDATPTPSSSFGPGSSGRETRDPRDDGPDSVGGVTGRPGAGPSAGLLGAVAVLLAVIVGSLSFAVWRRGPRGPTNPDRAYRTVTGIASRFGFAPRPNQTVYEFSGALGDVLPDARPALETVARAKVETAYGRGVLGPERLTALRDAERRLRTMLLRLLFRRGKGRPRA